uniref:Uncharacterized protein n=1 Tax=Anguilla anguilla TaxID=7936 RepID=A0A0E9S9K9_ANGAN
MKDPEDRQDPWDVFLKYRHKLDASKMSNS